MDKKSQHALGVETRFLGPTNYRGARIVASTASGSRIVVSWDYALDSGANHEQAAVALLRKIQADDLKSHGWEHDYRIDAMLSCESPSGGYFFAVPVGAMQREPASAEGGAS